VREAIRAAGSGHRLVTGEARWVGPDAVTLADGQRLEGQVVIDGRGADAEAGVNFEIAYQKFVGLEVELEQDHGLAAPILMDATVEQLDGYRFVYVLPFGPRRMLIEDTRYSDRPDLQPVEIRRAIDAYAGSHGWAIRRLVREEDGVLPIVLAGDIEAHWLDGEGVPRSGLRAMLFHPTTGYSLADAVDLAERIASEERLDSENILRVTRELSIAKWRRRSFFRRLNRMMFLAAEPEDRFRVLERFYRLPLGLTQRFYAGRLTWWDKIRLLAGRPPVSVRRALANFAESAVG
jgi:lycopene beta-cyclase